MTDTLEDIQMDISHRSATIFILMIAIVLCLHSLMNYDKIEKLTKKTDSLMRLEIKIDSLIQERGTNLHNVDIQPDSIYYITFNEDTIWYKKVNK